MKKLITGIKPTGSLTLGNYLGAIKNLVNLQKELTDTEFFIFIADLHAITTPQDKQALRKNIKDIAAIYVASGLDLEKTHIFIQSEVFTHNQLGYIMESTGYIGELQRMIQFKEKSKQQPKDGIRTSLLTYPALMAADILLYDANYVPIGEDQTQHLELTKLLGERFNSMYGDTFVIPEGILPKAAKKIKSLTNPTVKMSKSDDSNPKSYILLLDDINYSKNKIKSAVTDSDTIIKYDEENKPGISNLINIYSGITDLSRDEIVSKYTNKTYKDFKEDLANILENELLPLQNKYKEIVNSKELDEILDKGRDEALKLTTKKIKKVYKKIGLGRNN